MTTSRYNCSRWHIDATIVAHMERDNVCSIFCLLAILLLLCLSYYFCHYCTLNLSSPLILSINNMSLYHLPFLADVGCNKFHKDDINIGIGEEPNRSDKLLLLFSPLLFYYHCHYCTLNLSSPLILFMNNMSLYHLPFLADVGCNKLHKDDINTGIGEEPNRSDKLLLVASFSSFLLFVFLSFLFLTLLYAIYTKFYFIFIYFLLFYSKIPLTL